MVRVSNHGSEGRTAIATFVGLLAVLLLIAGNAFFVAAEFALVAVDRTRVERESEQGGRRARLVLGLLRRLSHHLSGAQLGITVTSLLLGFIAEPTIARVIEPAFESALGPRGARTLSIITALMLATVAQMVLGELIPKSVAIARPMATVRTLGPAIRGYSVVFGPLISVLDRSANWAVRRLGIEPTEELTTVRSLAELDLLFQASGERGALDPKATRLLRRSIRFGEKTAADVLVPRTALTSIGLDATVVDLVELARTSGYSRFLVHGRDIDDVRGVIHIKAAQTVPRPDRAATTVGSLMSEVTAVPETRELDDLLVDIQRSRSHLAVVVDEYGGTAGIVTLEDIVEEIVGDIADEYDRPGDITVLEQPGEWVLAGSLHRDEVQEVCDFEMPEGPFDTLAGFVLERLGRVPDGPGAEFVHDGWRFEVTEMDRLRVAAVRVTPPGVGTP